MKNVIFWEGFYWITPTIWNIKTGTLRGALMLRYTFSVLFLLNAAIYLGRIFKYFARSKSILGGNVCWSGNEKILDHQLNTLKYWDTGWIRQILFPLANDLSFRVVQAFEQIRIQRIVLCSLNRFFSQAHFRFLFFVRYSGHYDMVFCWYRRHHLSAS